MEWSLCARLAHARGECDWGEIVSFYRDHAPSESWIARPTFHVAFLLRWLSSNQTMATAPFGIMDLNGKRQSGTRIVPLTCASRSHRYQEHIFRHGRSFAEMCQSRPRVTVWINAMGRNVAERAQDGSPDITESDCHGKGIHMTFGQSPNNLRWKGFAWERRWKMWLFL